MVKNCLTSNKITETSIKTLAIGRLETRKPIPATKDHPQRVDYEYERNGTASIFMFCEPLGGWRQATAREHRTKFDWAQEVASLLDGKYADCERILDLSLRLVGCWCRRRQEWLRSALRQADR